MWSTPMATTPMGIDDAMMTTRTKYWEETVSCDVSFNTDSPKRAHRTSLNSCESSGNHATDTDPPSWDGIATDIHENPVGYLVSWIYTCDMGFKWNRSTKMNRKPTPTQSVLPYHALARLCSLACPRACWSRPLHLIAPSQSFLHTCGYVSSESLQILK